MGVKMPKVLLVEDNKHSRTILAEILSEAGYEVETVADRNSAMNQIGSQVFDAALVDLRLPTVAGAFDEDKAHGLLHFLPKNDTIH
jgi:CheY-like chemotaxis protein